MWDLPGPGRVHKGRPLSYTTSETLYKPPSAEGFSLHYVYRDYYLGTQLFAATLILVNTTEDGFTSKSTGPPVLERKSTPIRNFRQGSWFSHRKGLHMELARPRGSLHLSILVTPLDGPVSEGRRKSIRILVALPLEEVRDSTWKVAVDMDEATGRVAIWGWDCGDDEATIFIGDLV